MGVQAVCPIPPDIVRAQITSVMDDLQPVAIKIGMVHNAAIVHTVAECLQKFRPRFVVYDPVMVSTSGRKLMTEDTVRTIQEELFPLCSLITPNLGEASLLLSNPVTDIEEMKLAACELANRYHCAVLVKGGHLSGNTMCVRQAKVYISKAICHGKDLHIGHGNGPLCHFFSGEINFVPLNSTEEVIRKFPHKQQAEYREENFQGETS